MATTPNKYTKNDKNTKNTKKKKRDWKYYEKSLRERHRKYAQTFIEVPSKKEVKKELRKMNRRKQGSPYKVPDSVIVMVMFLQHLLNLSDRASAALVEKIMRGALEDPNFTFSHVAYLKRKRKLKKKVEKYFIKKYKLKDIEGKIIYIDGTGIKIGKSGFYRKEKYKGKEIKFLKLLFTVGEDKKVRNVIIGNDRTAEIKMFKKSIKEIVEKKPKAIVGDGAYNSKEIITLLKMNGINPVIKASKPSKERILRILKQQGLKYGRDYYSLLNKLGLSKKIDYLYDDFILDQLKEGWSKESGYNKRWVYSEGTFSNFKRMFSDVVRSRTMKGVELEILTKVILYNELMEERSFKEFLEEFMGIR